MEKFHDVELHVTSDGFNKRFLHMSLVPRPTSSYFGMILSLILFNRHTENTLFHCLV